MILFYISIEISTLFSLFSVIFIRNRIELNYFNSKIFKFIVNRILQFGIVGRIVKGEEYLNLNYSVVYVANHQSTLDMLMMAYAMPKSTVFMVKKQLAWVPIMGQFMMAGKNVFLDRSNRESAVDSMNKVCFFYLHLEMT